MNDTCIVQKCEGIQHAKLTQNVLKLTEMFKMDDFYNWRNVSHFVWVSFKNGIYTVEVEIDLSQPDHIQDSQQELF